MMNATYTSTYFICYKKIFYLMYLILNILYIHIFIVETRQALFNFLLYLPILHFIFWDQFKSEIWRKGIWKQSMNLYWAWNTWIWAMSLNRLVGNICSMFIFKSYSRNFILFSFIFVNLSHDKAAWERSSTNNPWK